MLAAANPGGVEASFPLSTTGTGYTAVIPPEHLETIVEDSEEDANFKPVRTRLLGVRAREQYMEPKEKRLEPQEQPLEPGSHQDTTLELELYGKGLGTTNATRHRPEPPDGRAKEPAAVRKL